jgi:hypothetical protein
MEIIYFSNLTIEYKAKEDVSKGVLEVNAE